MSPQVHVIGQTKTNTFFINTSARKDCRNEQKDSLHVSYLRNICLCTQVQMRQNAGERWTLVLFLSVEHHPPFLWGALCAEKKNSMWSDFIEPKQEMTQMQGQLNNLISKQIYNLYVVQH